MKLLPTAAIRMIPHPVPEQLMGGRKLSQEALKWNLKKERWLAMATNQAEEQACDREAEKGQSEHDRAEGKSEQGQEESIVEVVLVEQAI
ncbi:hypothetical protein JZ751_000654 [Albula glossodonta]|uniref:Uncharacterized protein n=1 Tax=Albula glossodonta TaxID=121402 RepID=A0A8T2PWC5_9TELE|nr:hypothetical protein JZ751_000654 [Albula glossodonta]